MNLTELERLLTKPPREIFGRGAWIDKNLKRLQTFCHPDRFNTSVSKTRAEQLFKKLGVLAEQARQPSFEIKAPKRVYQECDFYKAGDVADLYTSQNTDRSYLLKVSRVPGAEKMLDQERQALAAIHTAAKDSNYRFYFPLLVESFPAHDKIQRRVNVFWDDLGWYSLEQVFQQHKDGLDGRHLAWIFKRLLTALGFAHRQDLVHGAVLPCHVLVSPANHGLMLVGWGQSVQLGQRLTTACKNYVDWYPREVKAKQGATASTDIFMAAQTMLWLSGGSVEKRLFSGKSIPITLERFFYSCLLPGQNMRPDDAWLAHDEFDEVLRQVYGPPKFVELVMS